MRIAGSALLWIPECLSLAGTAYLALFPLYPVVQILYGGFTIYPLDGSQTHFCKGWPKIPQKWWSKIPHVN